MPIIVNDLLYPAALKGIYPIFNTIDLKETKKLEVGMEVKVRRMGENFRVRVDEIDGNTLIGKVIGGTFYFPQPFQKGDIIQFEKLNVINIYDIRRWGALI